MNMDPLEKNREMDRWLDDALGQYSKAEPRPGLENRILASLQSERTKTVALRPWGWASGAVLAALTVAVAVWIGHRTPEAPRDLAANPEMKPHEQAREIPPMPVAPSAHAGGAVSHFRRSPQLMQSVKVESAPKLEHFPAPQPLNEQEELLMRYVAKDPERAVLVAQARAEARQRDLEEEARAAARKNIQK
jgi:hypothetical protein